CGCICASVVSAFRRMTLRSVCFRQTIWREAKCHAVHTVPQTGGTWTVREHVSEVAAALRAVDLRPHHEQRAIDGRADGIRKRFPEAGPARAALIFRRRREQRVAAAGTGERADAFFRVEWAAVRPLGRVAT